MIHLLASIGIMVGMVMLGLAVGSARDELAAKRDAGGQVSNGLDNLHNGAVL